MAFHALRAAGSLIQCASNGISLPVSVRALLRGVGVQGRGDDARGAALASYLLFEPGFVQALMALGEADVHARADEIRAFLSI